MLAGACSVTSFRVPRPVNTGGSSRPRRQRNSNAGVVRKAAARWRRFSATCRIGSDLHSGLGRFRGGRTGGDLVVGSRPPAGHGRGQRHRSTAAGSARRRGRISRCRINLVGLCLPCGPGSPPPEPTLPARPAELSSRPCGEHAYGAILGTDLVHHRKSTMQKNSAIMGT
jgi:hypothetical protein